MLIQFKNPSVPLRSLVITPTAQVGPSRPGRPAAGVTGGRAGSKTEVTGLLFFSPHQYALLKYNIKTRATNPIDDLTLFGALYTATNSYISSSR